MGNNSDEKLQDVAKQIVDLFIDIEASGSDSQRILSVVLGAYFQTYGFTAPQVVRWFAELVDYTAEVVKQETDAKSKPH